MAVASKHKQSDKDKQKGTVCIWHVYVFSVCRVKVLNGFAAETVSIGMPVPCRGLGEGGRGVSHRSE